MKRATVINIDDCYDEFQKAYRNSGNRVNLCYPSVFGWYWFGAVNGKLRNFSDSESIPEGIDYWNMHENNMEIIPSYDFIEDFDNL